MSINVNINRPSLPIQLIPLEEGKSLNVEPGSMHACKNVTLATSLSGSVWRTVKLYFLGGENVFMNTYTAKENGAWLALEEAHRGQVASYQLLPGETLFLKRGAYVASDSNVLIDTQFAGVSYWAKGLGFWKITASVKDELPGRIFFDTKQGIIKAVEIVKEDGPVLVDNEQIIGHTSALKMSWKKIGGVKTVLFSGEGFVNEVSGKGTVFVGTTATKVDKANFIQKTITTIIDGLSDGKVSSATLSIVAAAIIIGTSRVNEVVNTHSLIGRLFGIIF